ncbi:dipeptidase [Aeromicrobium sp. A1-2]|uniref:dipeptidase n=1 Tax=Aeromicrobium sp. A1-2 TaxID=2107713 RepID=UPI000E4853A0|nr:dipeptidase [Aeromicrobium sp. A1-2]AXT85056.1 dipeptidase [Aeromicrobium sp. A1-2]
MPTSELKAKIAELMPQCKTDLSDLVAFRSVADPASQPISECHQAADWIVQKFTEAGLQEMTRHRTSDGSDCVTGHATGPEGAPTVLLYCHYDVQPPLGEDNWRTPVWQLTDGDDGRWYGRGTADSKGNIVAHLTALRALRAPDGSFPITVKFLAEGSEEQGTGGVEDFVPEHADLLRADAICVVDVGNEAIGQPTLTTSLRGMATVDITLSALVGPLHSGVFGGAAPDALTGLIQVLASLNDGEGNTTIDGLDNNGVWPGSEYSAEQFRTDANVLDEVELVGSGCVADMLWSRLVATVLGIDVPAVEGSVSAIQASVRARISLRVPPLIDAHQAQDALVSHLEARVPWHLRALIERIDASEPFSGSLAGPAFEAMRAAMEESYGRPIATQGQGGSIPLCNVFQTTFPDAEIMLYGVEEPQCLIHAPNESVAPSEIEHIALTEALFMRNYSAAQR